MIITLAPQYGAPPLELSRQGDTLIVNGDALDFQICRRAVLIRPRPSTIRMCQPGRGVWTGASM